MRELGLAMNGLEKAFEAHLLDSIDYIFPYTYVEIGVASGKTLVAVADTIKHSLRQGKQWTAVGVELPDGYSLDRDAIIKNAADAKISLNMVDEIGDIANPYMNEITVFFKASQLFFVENWGQMINFVLIDGCHCRKCATMDFLLIEPFVKYGGMVAFHDFEAIAEPQPHGPLDVLGAVDQLGLSDGRRKGWHYLTTLQADKEAGGRNMGLFRKVM